MVAFGGREKGRCLDTAWPFIPVHQDPGFENAERRGDTSYLGLCMSSEALHAWLTHLNWQAVIRPPVRITQTRGESQCHGGDHDTSWQFHQPAASTAVIMS